MIFYLGFNKIPFKKFIIIFDSINNIHRSSQKNFLLSCEVNLIIEPLNLKKPPNL